MMIRAMRRKRKIEVKAGETSKEIELKEGVEYNYEVEKTGYETTKDGRFTVEAEKADIDILLTMSEIHTFADDRFS